MRQTTIKNKTNNKILENEQSLFSIYFWILAYLKPYIRLFIFITICVVTITVVELIIPQFIQIFIDEILPEKNYEKFTFLLICIAFCLLLMITSRALQNIFQRSLQEMTARDFERSIFEKIRSLGFAYYEQHPVGESLAIMNTEVASVQKLYSNILPNMLRFSIYSLFSIGFMIHSSLQVTLATVPFILIYYITGPYFEKKAALTSKKMAESRTKYNQKIYESVSALNELRSSSSESWDFNRVKSLLLQYNKNFLNTYWYTYWANTFRRVAYNSGGMVAIIYGVNLVREGSLMTGEFVTFLFYYFHTMHLITSVVTSITEQKILVHQAEKLYKFMGTVPLVRESDNVYNLPSPRGEVELRKVSFHYSEETPILKEIDIHINVGEHIAFVGESGSGKSTILKLISRFYDPTEGDILLDGVSIRNLPFSTLRNTIGYVFQDTYLFGASVRDNILFGNPSATEEELITAAKSAYAHDFIMQLPQGYDTLLGERGLRLSGGQKQRIAIARMFIKNPTIILLDEATSSLDNISELEVQKGLNKLLKNRTTITIAHRILTVKDYDRIVVIHKGIIQEFGDYDTLIKKQGFLYQKYRGELLQNKGTNLLLE